MGEYIVKVKVGNGTATYRFDLLERAMEIVRMAKSNGDEFETNFEEEQK